MHSYKIYECLGTSAMTATVNHIQILVLQALPYLPSFFAIETSYGEVKKAPCLSQCAFNSPFPSQKAGFNRNIVRAHWL